MDEEEQEPGRYNPVVRVPVKPAEVPMLACRREYIEAPLDVATQWDERIWRQA